MSGFSFSLHADRPHLLAESLAQSTERKLDVGRPVRIRAAYNRPRAESLHGRLE